MLIRTDAVVLRGLSYGETSRIVTLFTRERGKVTVMAKGARLPKSRFGSTLQPMSYTQVVFYYKPNRGIQTLSESAHVTPFHGLGRDLEKLGIGMRCVELINALMQDEEQSPLIFNLLLQVLHRLDVAEANTANLLPYFQLKLAAALGFAPAIDRDAVRALPEEGGRLALDTGAILPPNTPETGQRASRTALRAFSICARAELEAVMCMHLPPGVRLEVDRLVEDYLRYHVEEAYPVRTNKVMGQLFSTTGPPLP